MKIAVTSNGSDLNATVCSFFGRAPFFVFVDSDTMAFESFPNPAADTPSGAGIQTAQFVMEKQHQALLTGHLGTNAFQVVEAGGFSAYAVSDTMTVREAVERFNAGDLDPIQSPGASGRGKGRGRRGR